jgi:hypothetical protein
MSRSVPMIGLAPEELPWVRSLIALLRHSDPTVPELARQALLYLARAAENTRPAGPAQKTSMLQCRE